MICCLRSAIWAGGMHYSRHLWRRVQEWNLALDLLCVRYRIVEGRLTRSKAVGLSIWQINDIEQT